METGAGSWKLGYGGFCVFIELEQGTCSSTLDLVIQAH